VLFVSEESNPKAQAVYDRINAEFTAETGIEVVMEYPGFTNIAQRVATLIAAGTPPEIVWFGAGQAMDLALADQLADVGDVVEALGIPDNLRMVVDGADRSVPTSQQFTYGWYRSDLYDQNSLQPYESWEGLPQGRQGTERCAPHLRQHRPFDQSRRLASAARDHVPQERRALVRLQRRQVRGRARRRPEQGARGRGARFPARGASVLARGQHV